jgi:hypothetical protein
LGAGVHFISFKDAIYRSLRFIPRGTRKPWTFVNRQPD